MAGPDQVGLPVREDALLRGRVPLRQPREGYRVNVDALWLAAFARAARPAACAIDLGAGVGSVGLVLAVGGVATNVTLLEVDAQLVALARANALASGLGERVDVMEADLAAGLPRERWHSFDLVVANPPYGIATASLPVAEPRRARARIGDVGTLAAFARAARSALGAAGRACFVHPAGELERLLATLRAVGLEPKRLRMVHPFVERPANVALVEAKAARRGGLRVAPPLVAMRAPGVWTDEARDIVEGGAFGLS